MRRPRPASERPVIEVQGPEGAALSWHKCRCRQIIPVYPGSRISTCHCGQRFRWATERSVARKVVVIEGDVP